MDYTLNTPEREFIVQIRSLLLKVVDLIDRRYHLGKYKGVISEPLVSSDSVTIAGMVSPAAVDSEQKASIA